MLGIEIYFNYVIFAFVGGAAWQAGKWTVNKIFLKYPKLFKRQLENRKMLMKKMKALGLTTEDE